VKWDIRQEEETLLNYETGIRGFLDRFSGKRDEKIEELNRAVRQAKGKLESLIRQQESAKGQLAELETQSTALPDAAALEAQARQHPETEKVWAELEADLRAQMLLPLLEKNLETLDEYHQLLRGAKVGEVMTRERLYEIGTKHIRWGSACMEQLRQLQSAMAVLKGSWEIPGYFENPAGFIESAASKYNQIDRAATAMDQVRKAQREMKQICQKA